MTIAGCGHTIDAWFASPRIVCKTCFEKQGFTYNENSYRDMEDTRLRAGIGPAVADYQKPKPKKTPADGPHGFDWTYSKGCRCALCCAAATKAHLERRHRKAA